MPVYKTLPIADELADIRLRCERLIALCDDPHPYLVTWRSLLTDNLRRLALHLEA